MRKPDTHPGCESPSPPRPAPPPGASANETLHPVFCVNLGRGPTPLRCQQTPRTGSQAALRLRRTKHKARADKAKAAPRVRMQRARVTRTRRETLRGRADAASTTEGFLEGIYVQKDGSPDGLKAEELLSLLKKSEHWSLFPSSSQLCLK